MDIEDSSVRCVPIPHASNLLKIVLFCLTILSFLFSNLSHSTEEDATTYILVSNEVPPGFEDLAGPQTNQIDVYVHNNQITSTFATYDFETFTFENPQLVVDNIEDLLDPQAIVNALSQPLNTNSDRLCLQHIQVNKCGVLEPNIAGIIFDESKFRVDIFINPLQLKTKTVYQSKYLPTAEDKLSTIHALNLNLSGTDEIEDSFNVQANSIVAFGENKI